MDAWSEFLKEKPNNGNPGRRESEKRREPDPAPVPPPNPSPAPDPSPQPSPNNPNFPTNPNDDASSSTPAPRDPNDKIGPAGQGPQGWITSGTLFPYTIRFENVADAEAPAAIIDITDVLDEDLDLSTLELNEIAFADVTIPIPRGLNHYEDFFPYVFNGTPIYVDVQASLDFETRTLTVHLEAVDPITGWLPENPFVGLLAPDDPDGTGEGRISYTIRHLPGLPSGTEIENKASIIFDFNDPIETPLVVNTLDDTPPESAVLPLPASVEAGDFTLAWTGTDNPNGSGVATYDIYASINDGPYALFFAGSPDTSGAIETTPGYTYAFYSIAHDNAGHVEEAPEEPDAVISVAAPASVEAGGDQSVLEGDPVGLPGALITFSGGLNGLDVRIEWGDGSEVEDGSIVPVDGGATVSSTHRYPDEGGYIVKLCVGGRASTTACDTLKVTAQNAPPRIAPQDPQQAGTGMPFALRVDFTDPGTADMHTATIDWGDETPVEAAGISENAGVGQILGSHTFAEVKSYTVTVTVTDDAQASDSVQFTVDVLEGSVPEFHRGDADNSGQLQLTDAVRILNVLFLGIGALPCQDSADADDNGQIQLTDAVRILNVLFLGIGSIPPPGAPSEACGEDPGTVHLGCDNYTWCP